MSNPVIEELLKYFETQGLTFDLICGLSDEDLATLPGPNGSPLIITQRLALKQVIKLRKPKEDSASQILIRRLEKEKEELELKKKKAEEDRDRLSVIAKTKFAERESIDKYRVEMAYRKHRVSDLLSRSREMTIISLGDVQKMVAELRNLGTSLDICFCMDATGSMSGIINNVKKCIVQVSQQITSSTGMVARFGLVVYRDYGDGANRHQIFDFTTSEGLKVHLGTINAFGGGDGPEDCFGGILASASRVSWKSPSRIIIWMGDAPQHGSLYNGGQSDSYPGGDPDGVTSKIIFEKMKENKIILVFCKLNTSTNAMIAQLRDEVAPYGDGLFLEYNFESDMGKFLSTVVHTTTSKTAAFSGSGAGKEKTYRLVPLGWEINSTEWNKNEECKIISFNSYNCTDLHPLLDLLLDGPDLKSKESQICITINPVAKGEMRLAYNAKIIETGFMSRFRKNEKKGIVKESRFEGSHNSRRALIDQAHIQSVALFLATEFNSKLKKIRNDLKKITYVPVELLYIPNRPTEKSYYSLEPYIEGDYQKFNNNNGFVDRELEVDHYILQTFTHFTYCYSRGLLMVTDIQGVAQPTSYKLTDPAIHTTDPKNVLPDRTNLGTVGISAFFSTHRCNDFCVVLNLKRPEELDISTPLETITEKESYATSIEDYEEAWEAYK
jgi:Alpha-kinase family